MGSCLKAPLYFPLIPKHKTTSAPKRNYIAMHWGLWSFLGYCIGGRNLLNWGVRREPQVEVCFSLWRPRHGHGAKFLLLPWVIRSSAQSACWWVSGSLNTWTIFTLRPHIHVETPYSLWDPILTLGPHIHFGTPYPLWDPTWIFGPQKYVSKLNKTSLGLFRAPVYSV